MLLRCTRRLRSSLRVTLPQAPSFGSAGSICGADQMPVPNLLCPTQRVQAFLFPTRLVSYLRRPLGASLLATDRAHAFSKRRFLFAHRQCPSPATRAKGLLACSCGISGAPHSEKPHFMRAHSGVQMISADETKGEILPNVTRQQVGCTAGGFILRALPAAFLLPQSHDGRQMCTNLYSCVAGI